VRRAAMAMLLTAIPCFSQGPQAAVDNSTRTKTEAASEGISREQADAILQELKAIHQLLEKQQTAAAQAQPQIPQKVKVSVKVDPGWLAVGRDDAPVTIMEFNDYQCPFCRKYHSQTFAELKKSYIDTGKVRYISRDFPLDFHANAPSAALAARCAADQNKFWEMRELLLGTSADLSAESINKYGEQLKLDGAAFHACISTRKYSADVQKDMAAGSALGVNATPSFVVGKTAKDQIDGLRLTGALPYSYFDSVIQEQLHPPQAAVVAK
jgi:protein-disulfide isomerase